MPDLKLAKLPDRTPVKISIAVSPDLNRELHAYAQLYQETYGTAESVPEMIPYMLEGFLESDRRFAKSRKERPVQLHDTSTNDVALGRPRRTSMSDPSPASN